MLWSIGSRGGLNSGTERPPKPRRTPGRRVGGFTLLEVIVAFTILAIALVGLLQAFATGMKGLSAAQASAAAVMHARSKMDEIGQTIVLEDGELSGEFSDGYSWSVIIARVEDPGDFGRVQPIAIPYEVEVRVAGPRGGGLTLKTLRLGSAR